MKKIVSLFAIAMILTANQAIAQPGGGDPEAMMARMKERLKPQLIEKAKLTDAEADKVVVINFEARQDMRGMRDMNEADRKKKGEEIQAGLIKKYKEIPLTDDQIKAVQAYFEEARRNAPQRQSR